MNNLRLLSRLVVALLAAPAFAAPLAYVPNEKSGSILSLIHI